MISGGNGGSGGFTGGAGGAGISNAGTIATLTNSGAIKAEAAAWALQGAPGDAIYSAGKQPRSGP